MEPTTDDLFAGQYGLVSRAQAADRGLSARQMRYRVATGVWAEDLPSVFRHPAAPPSWEQQLLAVVLSSGGIASHRAAAALWHLELYTAPCPEVSIPHGRRFRYEQAIVHHSTQWERRDADVRRGIACTGVDRTLLDCGAVMSVRTLERLCESAIRQRHTTWPSLLHCLMRHSVQGRTGCGNLRKLLERRLGDQTVPLSDFSRLVANLLVEAGIPRPVLEFRIVDQAGRLVLQSDLAWPLHKKAWELDGLAFHFGRTDIERDKRKRNRAKALGWNIQEILWSMYVDQPKQLVAMARAFLAS